MVIQGRPYPEFGIQKWGRIAAGSTKEGPTESKMEGPVFSPPRQKHRALNSIQLETDDNTSGGICTRETRRGLGYGAPVIEEQAERQPAVKLVLG